MSDDLEILKQALDLAKQIEAEQEKVMNPEPRPSSGWTTMNEIKLRDLERYVLNQQDQQVLLDRYVIGKRQVPIADVDQAWFIRASSGETFYGSCMEEVISVARKHGHEHILSWLAEKCDE